MPKLPISLKQALQLVKINDEQIHTYTNPKQGVLIGYSYTIKELTILLKDNYDKIEISGKSAIAINHGICVFYYGEPLFIETDPEKLSKFLKDNESESI